MFLAETFFRDLEAGSGLDRESLVEGQKADLELSQIRQTAMTEGEVGGVPVGYFMQNDVLMRKWRDPRSPTSEVWSVVRQVMLPPSCRPEVLCLAHKAPVAGHGGVRRPGGGVLTLLPVLQDPLAAEF